MAIANYSMLGSLTVVPQADLQNLVSPVNLRGDGRKGSDNLGKYPTLRVVVPSGTLAGAYSEFFCTGGLSSSPWTKPDGSFLETPVNVLNAGGGAAWTLTTATYTGGLLTASGAATVNATQGVALKKGTYRLNGLVNRAATGASVKLVLTGGTSGVVLTKTFNTAVVSAGNTTADAMEGTFTLTADETVTINLNIVDTTTGAATTGAGRVNFIFEGIAAG